MEFVSPELQEASAEERRSRLKSLIVLGKERGYLTYAEINDHLPDKLVEAANNRIPAKEAFRSVRQIFIDLTISLQRIAERLERWAALRRERGEA